MLTWERVQFYLDLGRNTAHKLRKIDPRFPRPVRLPGVHPRWDLRDLEAYVEQVKAEAEGA